MRNCFIKFFSAILCLTLELSFISCSKIESQPKEINLDKANINQYLEIKGSFIDGYIEPVLSPICYTSYATIDLETYPTAPGSFKNVQITLEIKSTDTAFTQTAAEGDFWHLVEEKDQEKIIITIKLSTDGRFENQYKIKCTGDNTSSQILDSGFQYEILSISGTFIEN